jgi:predicted nuclease of predicted toxin-antitoxin system
LTLKFKVDENMPAEAAAMLTLAGHDATTVPDQQMGGRPDPDVAAVCRQEDRAVVTLDLDFSDIRAYPPTDYCGIVVLRLARLDKRRVLVALQRLLPLLDQEPLAGKLWIVDETTVRIRG